MGGGYEIVKENEVFPVKLGQKLGSKMPVTEER